MSTAANEKNLRVGTRVRLTEKNVLGTIAYVGTTQFQPGKWIGVVLDDAIGKNNGSVQGKEYFKCNENHGIFVRPGQVVSLDDENDNQAGGDAPPTPKPAEEKPSTGLRQPQSAVKKAGAKGDEPPPKEPSPGAESKMKLPTATKSRLPASSSKENLKQSPSMEKLSSGMRSSPSVEKLGGLKEEEASTKAKPSKLSSPVAAKDSRRATMDKTPSIPTPEGQPAGEEDEEKSSVANVSSRVMKIQQGLTRNSITEGIVRMAPSNLSEGAELEWLRAEAKELSEKLETLRTKRQEDKQKLIDYEKCKIQLQQLVEYKTKMNELHGELQKQLQQARKEAKEAIEARETYQDEMSGLSEAIEMATLDKEMAEERADMLQQEVDALKDRVQELDADLEILKHDMEEKGGEAGAATTYQVKQLEQQNERLKEAVIKMRDLSAHERKETVRMTKELDTLKSTVGDLQKRNDKLSEDAEKYEQQTIELKEQVDAALGSESMIEQLTTRNLALEERVRELEETVEDFEQMRQMDEELQESSKDQERELRQELDMARGKINELKVQLQQSHSQMSDYEMTIRKFREHTAQLQEQIQDLKDKLLTKEARQEFGDDGLLLDGRSAFGRGRSLAELVDNEVLKIEMDNHQQHLRYLRSFMPDNFTKNGGDNDALVLTLLFPRLAGKAQLLILQLNEKYPQVPGGVRREHVVKSHKSEQWSFVAKFTYYLNSLITILHTYESIIGQCSVERLMRLAKLQSEMSAQERLIDNYFDLLKSNRIDENTPLDSIEKAINFFRNMFTVHLATEPYDGTVFTTNIIRQLLSGTSWFKLDLVRAKFYMLENLDNSSLWKSFDEMELFVNDAEQFLRQAKTRIPQDSKTHVLKLPEEFPTSLYDTASNLEMAAELLHAACKSASTEVSMLPDVEGVDAERMNDHLQRAVQKLLGKAGENKSAQDVIKLSLGVMLSRGSKLADALESGQLDVPVEETKPYPPLLERAHARKQDAVENDGLRWQIEKKENEIVELKKALRLKAEEISEMNVRKEMAEKRLATSGKEGDERLVRLQRKIEEMQQDYKKKEREFEQTMDSLQQEIDNLEAENTDLKERNKMMAKKALLQGISTVQAGSGLSTSTAASTTSVNAIGLPSPIGQAQDSPMLLQQIEQLKSALLLTREEKCAIEAEKMNRILASLPPLNVPKKAIGLSAPGSTGLVDLDQLSHKRHDELNHLVRETARLQKDFQTYASNLKVVDISKRRAGEEPTLEKQTAAYQLMAQLQRAKKLNDWTKDAWISQLQGSIFPISDQSIKSIFSKPIINFRSISPTIDENMDDRSISALSNEELRDHLVKNGHEKMGPVVGSTRKVYENKLRKLLSSSSGSPTKQRQSNRQSQGIYPSLNTSPMINTNTYDSTPPDRVPPSSGSSQGSPVGRSGIGLGGGGGLQPPVVAPPVWSNQPSRDIYGDRVSSSMEDEDDEMRGEESFRYVGPLLDSSETPPSSGSPYSAMGGSLFKTQPRVNKTSFVSPQPTQRLDFANAADDSPPTFGGFTTTRSPSAYNNDKVASMGMGMDDGRGSPSAAAYRRPLVNRQQQEGFTKDPPTLRTISSNPYYEQHDVGMFDQRAIRRKLRSWLPWLARLIGFFILVVFIYMVIKRAMRSGMGDPEDDANELPA